jgi:hypothetical protein
MGLLKGNDPKSHQGGQRQSAQRWLKLLLFCTIGLVAGLLIFAVINLTSLWGKYSVSIVPINATSESQATTQPALAAYKTSPTNPAPYGSRVILGNIEYQVLSIVQDTSESTTHNGVAKPFVVDLRTRCLSGPCRLAVSEQIFLLDSKGRALTRPVSVGIRDELTDVHNYNTDTELSGWIVFFIDPAEQGIMLGIGSKDHPNDVAYLEVLPSSGPDSPQAQRQATTDAAIYATMTASAP